MYTLYEETVRKGYQKMLEIRTIPVGMGQANCYIISDDEEALIVDPGAGANIIQTTIEQIDTKPVAILLTHTHYDHIGALDAIREEYQVPVYVHPEEQAWLQDPAKNLSGLQGNHMTAQKADHFFQPKETLEISNFKLTVVSTPGHSPGGVSFIFEEDELVVTGDALFAGSIGRTDLPGSEPEKLLEGIREQLFTLPDDYTIYPGHGGQSTLGNEKQTNPFFN